MASHVIVRPSDVSWPFPLHHRHESIVSQQTKPKRRINRTLTREKCWKRQDDRRLVHWRCRKQQNINARRVHGHIEVGLVRLFYAGRREEWIRLHVCQRGGKVTSHQSFILCTSLDTGIPLTTGSLNPSSRSSCSSRRTILLLHQKPL